MTLGSIFRGEHDILLLDAAAVAVLLFLLHRSRSHRGRAAGRAPPNPPTAPATTTRRPQRPARRGSSPGVGPARRRPVRLGPPRAVTGRPPQQPAPRRLPVTPVTLGLALLAGGITAAIMLLAGVGSLANLPVLLGVVLAVIGAGLVVGAFLRSGRGLSRSLCSSAH